jgi:peptide-methionine (S)-S-oxide reductase
MINYRLVGTQATYLIPTHIGRKTVTRLRNWLLIMLLSFGLVSFGCSQSTSLADPIATGAAPGATSTAIFAGGCFWCMEGPFDEIPGVIGTTSGYTGGNRANPTYREVSSGRTGHAEAVQVTFDPKKVSYETLLKVFWRNVDPLDASGQFCDKGSQYRSAIFYTDAQQQKLAEKSKAAASQQLNASIVTEITPAAPFYPAEDYHQNYYQTHTAKYKFYRYACGRDRRLEEVWGKDAGH